MLWHGAALAPTILLLLEDTKRVGRCRFGGEQLARRDCQCESFRAKGERELTYYEPNAQPPGSIPGSRAEPKQGQVRRGGTAQDYL